MDFTRDRRKTHHRRLPGRAEPRDARPSVSAVNLALVILPYYTRAQLLELAAVSPRSGRAGRRRASQPAGVDGHDVDIAFATGIFALRAWRRCCVAAAVGLAGCSAGQHDRRSYADRGLGGLPEGAPAARRPSRPPIRRCTTCRRRAAPPCSRDAEQKEARGRSDRGAHPHRRSRQACAAAQTDAKRLVPGRAC